MAHLALVMESADLEATVMDTVEDLAVVVQVVTSVVTREEPLLITDLLLG